MSLKPNRCLQNTVYRNDVKLKGTDIVKSWPVDDFDMSCFIKWPQKLWVFMYFFGLVITNSKYLVDSL